MSVKTSKQLANEWEVSERTVSDWCKKVEIKPLPIGISDYVYIPTA